MKLSIIGRHSLLFLCLACFISACAGDDEATLLRLSPVESVAMPGEGTMQTITLASDKWSVAAVLQNGTVLRDKEGRPLQLSGTGRIEANWCTIERTAGNTLSFSASEHFAAKERRLSLRLQAGIYSEEITISQSSSFADYAIKSIVYSIGWDDHETEASPATSGITIRNGGSEIPGWPFRPYAGENSLQKFQGTKEVFEWTELRRDLLIDVPHFDVPYPESIHQMDDRQILFFEGYNINDSPLKELEVAIDVPAKKEFRIHADIYRKERQYSFELTIVNRHSLKERTVEGKLVQEFPYHYKITTTEQELLK